jgi:hypothetical protein
MPALERYFRHAERFGVELVFETAAGLGEPEPDLTTIELIGLARRLETIDPKFDSARPDQLIELAGAGHVRVPDDFPSDDPDRRYAYQRAQARRRWLERIAPVLDALRTPAPTSARRCCEWCRKAIAGRADRRTCTPTHRKALDRAGGVGPFSTPGVTPTGGDDLRIGLGRNVTPTPHEQGLGGADFRGVGDFREVPAGGREVTVS